MIGITPGNWLIFLLIECVGKRDIGEDSIGHSRPGSSVSFLGPGFLSTTHGARDDEHKVTELSDASDAAGKRTKSSKVSDAGAEVSTIEPQNHLEQKDVKTTFVDQSPSWLSLIWPNWAQPSLAQLHSTTSHKKEKEEEEGERRRREESEQELAAKDPESEEEDVTGLENITLTVEEEEWKAQLEDEGEEQNEEQEYACAFIPISSKKVVYMRQHRIPGSGEDFLVATSRNQAPCSPGVQFLTADGQRKWGFFKPLSNKVLKQVAIFEGQASLGNILVVLAVGKGSWEFILSTSFNPEETKTVKNGWQGHPVLYIFDMSKPQFQGISNLQTSREMTPDTKVILEDWNAALHVDLVNLQSGDGTIVLNAVVSSGFNTKPYRNIGQMAFVTIAVSATKQEPGKHSDHVDHFDSHDLQFTIAGPPLKHQIFVFPKGLNAPGLPYGPEGTVIVPHPDGKSAVVYTSGINPKKGASLQAVMFKADLAEQPHLVETVASNSNHIEDVAQFVGRSFTHDGHTYIVAADWTDEGSVLLYEVQWGKASPLLVLLKYHQLVHSDQSQKPNEKTRVLKTGGAFSNHGANRVVLRRWKGQIYAIVPFKNPEKTGGAVCIYRVFDGSNADVILVWKQKFENFLYTTMVVGWGSTDEGHLQASLIVPLYKQDSVVTHTVRILGGGKSLSLDVDGYWEELCLPYEKNYARPVDSSRKKKGCGKGKGTIKPIDIQTVFGSNEEEAQTMISHAGGKEFSSDIHQIGAIYQLNYKQFAAWFAASIGDPK